MTVAQWIVFALWLGLIIFWLIGAATAKRTADRGFGRGRLQKEIGVRALILALVVIVVRTPRLREAVMRLQADIPRNAALQWLGVAICAIGVGLALVARIQLGRNWGMPATLKENPDLITAGPYRLIRHPIYTGILIALFGTALVEGGILWLVPFVLGGIYFVLAARREERLMLKQFPDQYPAYMKRTKMLLPFIL